jgi:hypothetical protein
MKKRERIESCRVLFAPSRWPLILAFQFNYEFNRASNLKRNWVDLGLLKLRGKFRENWEGIQMQYIHVNSQKVNLK